MSGKRPAAAPARPAQIEHYGTVSAPRKVQIDVEDDGAITVSGFSPGSSPLRFARVRIAGRPQIQRIVKFLTNILSNGFYVVRDSGSDAPWEFYEASMGESAKGGRTANSLNSFLLQTGYCVPA